MILTLPSLCTLIACADVTALVAPVAEERVVEWVHVNYPPRAAWARLMS